MSLSGLFNSQFPLTLDGTTSLDVSSLTIDGSNVDLTNLVPYTGANQTLNLGSQNIQTSHVPVTGNDVVNLTTLTDAVTFVDTSVSLTYLNKITSSDQTVAGKVTYQKELVVASQKRIDLAGQVVIDASHQNLVTSASVTVGQYFGTITNAGGVFQSTSSNNPIPTLIIFPITSGNRYRFQIETLVEDATYDWTVDIYQSQDNVNPYPNFGGGILDSKTYSPGSVVFQAFDVTFVGNTTGTVVATISGTNPSGVGTLKWKNLKVYEMGVSLQNITTPSLAADQVVVVNDRKQLVSSGISTTKLGYLDNVSSDIQTQLNAKASTSYVDAGLAFKASITYVDNGLALKANLAGGNSFSGQQNYSDKTLNTVAVFDASKNLSSSAISTTELNYLSGTSSNIQTQLNGKLSLTGGTMTGAITMNGNKITTSYTPVNAEDLTRKGYVDTAISGAVGSYVLKAGDTMTGTLYNNGGSFHAYKAGDTNKGCILFANNADGASYATYNGGLSSWNGIGLYCSLDSTTRHVFGTRDGSTQQTGKLTCVGLDTSAIIQSGVNGNTTANIKLANSLSHIDNAAGEVYLFTGFQGHVAIGRNTTRDAFTANLCLGTANTEESQIISIKTDNSGYLPLTFASSRFVFSNGNVGIGQTNPFAPLHFANTVVNRKVVLYQPINNDHEFYGFGVNNNTLRYQVDSTTSNHIFYCGNGTTTSIERFRIQGNGRVGVGAPSGNLFVPNCKFTIGASYDGGDTGCFCINATDDSNAPNAYNLRIYPYVQSGGNVAYQFRTYNTSTAYNAFKIRSTGETEFEKRGYRNAGDNSKMEYGPNGTWGAYLVVGSGTNEVAAGKAQIISTDGNLHLDAAVGKSMYYGFYAGNNIHRFTGNVGMGGVTDFNATLNIRNPNGSATHFGYSDGYNYIRGPTWQNGVLRVTDTSYFSDWIRITNDGTGLYWEGLARGITSPEGIGNSYGNITTYGTGRNGWHGYGLNTRYVFMSNGTEWGIHDNFYSWLIYGTGSTTRDVKIGGGVAQFARNYDRMLIFANGNDTGGGYAYYNQANTLGTISDRRIKENFQRITLEQSVAFVKALEPTSFCLKEDNTKKKTTLPDGTEVEEEGSGVCICRQDGWVAQNVLEACNISGASKTVVNHWVEYEQELLKPEEERKTLIGVSDRPILSHTVNVVKQLLARVDILEQREAIWLQDAKQKEKEFTEYKSLTEQRLDKLASLVVQLMPKA